ncbi:MAG: hypothetical protein ACRD2U_17385 [Terriglobales bacterium]
MKMFHVGHFEARGKKLIYTYEKSLDTITTNSNPSKIATGAAAVQY